MSDVHELWDHMRLAGQARGPHPIQFGFVATYLPADNSATVYLPPDTTVTYGPFPLVTPWVGAGWGIQAGPKGGGVDGNGNPLGEPCVVLFPDPEMQLGFVILGHFSDRFPAPGAPAGEIWLKHKKGQTIKLTNDGHAQITGTKVEIGATGLTGDYAVVRNKEFQALVDAFNAHVHATAAIGPPVPPTPVPGQIPVVAAASSTVYAK